MSRWLIHNIAEQMTLASNSEGQDKLDSEMRCVDVILKYWANRNSLPNGIRPFEEFDSILRGLARLDNQPTTPYYNQFHQFEIDINNNESSEAKKWIDVAIKIDEGARALVQDSFKVASEFAKNKNTKELLDKSPEPNEDDIRVVLKIYGEDDESLSHDKLIKKRQHDLQNKLEKINNMIDVCKIHAEKIKYELENIDKP